MSEKPPPAPSSKNTSRKESAGTSGRSVRPFNAPKIADQITPTYYAAAYLDLMGIGSRLLQLPKNLPASESEAKEFGDNLSQNVGPVLRLANWIGQYFAEMSKSTIPESAINAMDEEGQEAYRRMTSASVTIQTFGDTVIAYLPLEILDDGIVIVEGLYRLVGACSVASTMSLLSETPCRGGMDIGWGIEPFEGQLHGRLLIDVCQLEASAAGYPRVVVGDTAVSHLSKAANTSGSRVLDVNAALANQVLPFLRQDDDRRIFVDFLGPAVRKLYPEPTVIDDAIVKVRAFAEQCIDTHSQKGDDKIVGKYVRLLRYLERVETELEASK